MSPRWVALGLFGLGAIVFTGLELTIPGLILLAAAFLVGVRTIASPEQLGDDGEESAARTPPGDLSDGDASGSA